MKMFAITTKHHEGFSMFDTKTRVKSRANWVVPGGPRIEPCDLAYSVMETPLRRDIIGELCDAAHKGDMKIDLYFSHPDWYDADFRPCWASANTPASSMNAAAFLARRDNPEPRLHRPMRIIETASVVGFMVRGLCKLTSFSAMEMKHHNPSWGLRARPSSRACADRNCNTASFSPGDDALTVTSPALLVIRTSAVAIPASARTGLAKIFSSPIRVPSPAAEKVTMSSPYG